MGNRDPSHPDKIVVRRGRVFQRRFDPSFVAVTGAQLARKAGHIRADYFLYNVLQRFRERSLISKLPERGYIPTHQRAFILSSPLSKQELSRQTLWVTHASRSAHSTAASFDVRCASWGDHRVLVEDVILAGSLATHLTGFTSAFSRLSKRTVGISMRE
jgi:hypothetical protein